MPLQFNTLLEDEGISPAEVRLLRHQTTKTRGKTPYSLWWDDREAFEIYQSTQDSSPRERAKFRGRYWASFVSPYVGATLFVGLYEAALVGTVTPGTIDPMTGTPRSEDRSSYDQYQCRRMDELATYVGRLYVHWGDSPSASRAWVQRADNQNKQIVELARTFREEAFPGFTRLIRPLSEIETMPASWKEVLRVSHGVYLLACPRTREHYVGAAYGEGGFLGRWLEYAATGHGGNRGLRSRDPSDYLGPAPTRRSTISSRWKRLGR